MRIWETGRASAAENMGQDVFLLENLEREPAAVLHIYDWQGDAATFGHFIDPGQFFDLDAARQKGLSLQKRPTGGGIIFHSYDATFSLVIPKDHPLYSPNTMESYANVNREVVTVIGQFLGEALEPALLKASPPPQKAPSRHFCMAHPTKYDVVIDKKVGGAAQRRTRHGLLHQGSVSLVVPPLDLIASVLKEGEAIHAEMMASSQPLLTPGDALVEGRRSFHQKLKDHFRTLA